MSNQEQDRTLLDHSLESHQASADYCRGSIVGNVTQAALGGALVTIGAVGGAAAEFVISSEPWKIYDGSIATFAVGFGAFMIKHAREDTRSEIVVVEQESGTVARLGEQLAQLGDAT